MGVGSGTVAPTTSDSALGGEITRLAVSSINTAELTAGPPQLTFQAVFATSDANTTIGEVALFNSSAAGTMICRATIASFVKATSNVFELSYALAN